ncbi:hypothetical protein HELRODRAFT_155870 [Helobdella robusta]|uniref:Probable imidazolonepropionase n=1 Tax=Helobdella robusta TaxID=6412 RepID=T1ELN5_HELRO|nr:hypothetical protein HELRODRAFT_155870 [Helobdella robusta]ESN98636.1 hypothetical protein HELRODRAFT_155870 [Helobdella robusta]
MSTKNATVEYGLLVKSAKQLVQIVNGGQKSLTSSGQGQGYIEKLGNDSEVRQWLGCNKVEKVIDASNKVVMPGLVDGHTHAVWAGDRVHEFAMKLAGATYLDVHKAGGGIHFTVRHVAEASEDQLFNDLRIYLLKMLQAGTTLVEVKTGYGLKWESELKMLRVIERAIRDESIAIDISVTYCAAHAVPIGMTAEEATVNIIEEQIPELQRLRLAGEIHVDNIDVFCEVGVFDVNQTIRILKAGIEIGLKMGASLNSTSMSHLEEISDEGIEAMSQSNTVAVLLPTTAYILRLQPPPARKMIKAGVAVALGSDFNPNAHCFAMPIVMHLACIQLKLTMQESLVAATLNAAASLSRSDVSGSLEEGKYGDILVLDAPRWEHLIFQLGSHHHVIEYVIKRGRVVHQSSRLS